MKIESPVLRRLGGIPFWRGETRSLEALQTIYSRAIEKARLAAAKYDIIVKKTSEGRVW